MSQNKKTFTEYDRFEWSKDGHKIHIWRQHTVFLSKREAQIAKENKEKMRLKT